MKQITYFLLFIFVVAGYMHAAGNDSLNAVANYNENGLQLHCALINDKGFFDEWQKPEMPKLNFVDTYKRGDYAIPIIIFGTNGKDEHGNADLTYDISVIKPDGTIYGDFKQLELWKNEPAPMLHLVKQPICIAFENKDPLGVYHIKMVIYDNNKGAKVNIELSLQVVE